MPIYAVEITALAIVVADNEFHALQVARSNSRAATTDTDPEIFVLQEITDLLDLPVGWDGQCLPYGGDGEKRLKELLPPNTK